MFSNLMSKFKPNLGSLEPEFNKDLEKFSNAVFYGKPDIVQELITKYKTGHDAFGNEIQNIDIVNYRPPAPFQDSIPLMLAIVTKNIYMIKLLLEAGADINAKNSNGVTPLMKAIYYGSYDIVDLLLEAGADIYIKNNDGNDSFSIACEMILKGKGYALVESLLKSMKDPEVKKKYATKELFEITKDYFQKSDFGHVKFLLEAGANVNYKSQIKDPITNKPINQTPLMGAAQKGEDSIVKMLLDKGADINANDFRGDSVLIYAIRGEDIDTIKILINNGAEFGDKEQQKLTQQSSELQKEVRKILDQHKSIMATEMLYKKQREYLDPSVIHDVAEYMGAKGGKSRRKRRTKSKKSKKRKTKKYRKN